MLGSYKINGGSNGGLILLSLVGFLFPELLALFVLGGTTLVLTSLPANAAPNPRIDRGIAIYLVFHFKFKPLVVFY